MRYKEGGPLDLLLTARRRLVVDSRGKRSSLVNSSTSWLWQSLHSALLHPTAPLWFAFAHTAPALLWFTSAHTAPAPLWFVSAHTAPVSLSYAASL